VQGGGAGVLAELLVVAKIDSMTTMELSTSMPIDSMRPISDMMLRVRSVSRPGARVHKTKVTTTDTGIATATSRCCGGGAERGT